MVFSSPLFLFVYLPTVLMVYYITPPKLRNLVLLLLSLMFYAWGEPIYVVLMVFSTVQDYVCSWYIEKYSSNARRKRLFLIISMVGNLTMLGVFKYLDFIIINLQHIPVFSGLQPLGIPLPIGISFYTFQTMSYTIDVYRGVNKAQKNIVTLGTYIASFPQLIAGPIIKYKDVSVDLEHRTYTLQKFSDGVIQFTVGMCKKVLVANPAGELFTIYQSMDAASVSTTGAWLAAIAFTIQIYFDFSGYSDMAIGLGKMLGFRFPANFNYPYIAESITDFWRRWHISLSSWFREYLYIPLGGNRKGTFRTIGNLLIVWLATGIWHGASWNYILWGLFYFILLVMEKQWLLKILGKIPHLFRHLYALLFIVLGWVIFANEDLSRGILMFKAMFRGSYGVVPEDLFYLKNYATIFVIAGLGSIPLWKDMFGKISPKVQGFLKIVLLMAGLFACTATLVDSTYNPFLYFRF